ncbi:PfkB family carbohydrate kinase [uncultured Olegusella sp.]|uniref:PfkB family carbohydrate kinase n=1 Tax=uncultured Olegusella sp. TaxID=1979846 RepID=UPI002619D3E4|nr:PfkB family carbohydrate kinase [uncultured Olegusella sp.]
MKIVGLGDNVFDLWSGTNYGYPGGNAVNVAVSATRLGCEGVYVGSIADDKWGRAIMAALRAERVDFSTCRIVAGGTTKRCISEPCGAGHHWLRNELGKNWPDYFALNGNQLEVVCDADVILTSCNAHVEDDLPRLADCRNLLSFDFGEKEKYWTPDYLKRVAPYIDLAQFSREGISVNEAASFYTALDLTCPVLVTRGPKAPILFCDGALRAIGIEVDKQPLDTLGAGDAFITALIVGLVKRGWKHKGKLPNQEACTQTLIDAAAHAERMCQARGAFGHGTDFSRPDAVIFDNDGVIVDTEPLYAEICQQLVRQYGKEMSASDVFALRGASDEHQAKIIGSYLGMDVPHTQRVVAEYFISHTINFADIQIPHAAKLICWLKEQGIRVGIASSSPMRDLKKVICELGLEDAFDVVASGEHFEESKPNPAIYTYVINKLGADPSRTVVIEDSQYGIEAGLRAGAEVLALQTPGVNIDLTAANFAFDNHKQIKQYLTDRLGI